MLRKYILLMSLLVFVGSVVQAVEQNKQAFAYDDYAVVLKNYVDDEGMVNYKKLKTEAQMLESFIAAMGKLDPNSYSKWNERRKITFWLNAYNAFTLKAIVDNYPIKPGFFRSMYYPKNSIRQISGVWDKITFKVMGKDYTLEHIEHKILRKKFDEPRIHMAMVCAAMGCPPLLNKPYIGQRLNEQLDGQTRRFLANSAKFKIDREVGVVYLSSIFKWFKGDFVNKYAPEKNISGHGKKVSAVLNFVAHYLEKTDREYILVGGFKVKYLKYDWSLNEQKIKNKKSKEPKR